MSNQEEILMQANLHKIATTGAKIYDSIRAQYEPKEKGKFLAINTESKDIFLADTSLEAVTEGRKIYPNTIFYLVKIGYDALETIASYAPARIV